jgi:hypothetical protein
MADTKAPQRQVRPRQNGTSRAALIAGSDVPLRGEQNRPGEDPQSAQSCVRMRCGLLVSSDHDRPGSQVVVPGAVYRDPPQERARRGVEASPGRRGCRPGSSLTARRCAHVQTARPGPPAGGHTTNLPPGPLTSQAS